MIAAELAWIEGWQAGFLFGVMLETLAVALVVFAARLRRSRRMPEGCSCRGPHCDLCAGCLDIDGRSRYSVEKLAICPQCGDTMPRPNWENLQKTKGRRR